MQSFFPVLTYLTADLLFPVRLLFLPFRLILRLFNDIAVDIRLPCRTAIALPSSCTPSCCHIRLSPFLNLSPPGSYTPALSKIRSLALFALLLFSTSSLHGRIGFLVTMVPFETFPHTHTGKSTGQVHGFSFLRKALLTIRSSREWAQPETSTST